MPVLPGMALKELARKLPKKARKHHHLSKSQSKKEGLVEARRATKTMPMRRQIIWKITNTLTTTMKILADTKATLVLAPANPHNLIVR